MGRDSASVFAAFVCLMSVFPVHSQSASTLPNKLHSVDDSRPAKFVVIPGCVHSHWYQALTITQELSKRGHKVQVRS